MNRASDKYHAEAVTPEVLAYIDAYRREAARQGLPCLRHSDAYRIAVEVYKRFQTQPGCQAPQDGVCLIP